MGRLSRRGFFKGTAALSVAAAAAAATRPGAAAKRQFSNVVDLTHPITADFPTFLGEPQLEIEAMYSLDEGGFNMNRWHLVEHTGTHIDAPIHFSENGADASAVPVEQLVVPLAVVSIAERAQDDPDAQLTPDDIAAWEDRHGDLPAGACVAMNSGWARHVKSDMYRNADDDGVMHFPGIHKDATAMLLERDLSGIAVDTLSLDYGRSQDFGTHLAWLPAGRWGIECLANLDQVPETGATIVVGGPKIVGATGGPSRAIALI